MQNHSHFVLQRTEGCGISNFLTFVLASSHLAIAFSQHDRWTRAYFPRAIQELTVAGRRTLAFGLPVLRAERPKGRVGQASRGVKKGSNESVAGICRESSSIAVSLASDCWRPSGSISRHSPRVLALTYQRHPRRALLRRKIGSENLSRSAPPVQHPPKRKT
jgi:hypothetical protein